MKTLESMNLELVKSIDGEYWNVKDKISGQMVINDSADEDYYCSEEDMRAIVTDMLNNSDELVEYINSLRD